MACAPVPVAIDSSGPEDGLPERAFRVERANAPALLANGEARLVSLALVNRGSRQWLASGPEAVRLTYRWEGNGTRQVGEKIALPYDVRPGGLVEVIARVTAPPTPGDYVLSWELSDATGPFDVDSDAAFTVAVRPPETRAEWQDFRAGPAMTADVRETASVRLRNVGTVAWPALGVGAVVLSYHWRDRAGGVVIWDGERTPLEDNVLPGEEVQATLHVLPPPATGSYVLEVDALREGTSWFGNGPRLAVDVREPSYAVVFSALKAPQRVVVGERIDLSLAVRNVGGTPWANGSRRTSLAYHVLDDAGRLVLWDGPRTELGKVVRPGDEVELRPTVLAPHAPGRYTFLFDLVRDGVTWFGRWNRSLPVTVDVAPLDFHAHFVSASASSIMATGLSYRVRASVQSVDRLPWPSRGYSPVRLSYHWLDQSGRTVVWDGARAEPERDIKPGEKIDFSLDVTAPEKPGKHTLVLDMVQEGISWFAPYGTIPARRVVDVVKPSFAAAFTADTIPERLTAGGIARARVTVRNDSPFPWSSDGEQPINLAHHWRTDTGQVVTWDGFRAQLPRALGTGESAELEVWFYVPVSPGRYLLEYDVVQEGLTWFGQRGSPLLRKAIDVVP